MPPRFSFRRKITASAVVIVLLFFGISTFQSNHPSFKSLADYQNQSLHWSSCYDAFECSSIKVPIDYNNIATGLFTLQVLRHRATDAKNRIGSLVVNPGGPGASGFDYAYNAESIRAL